MKFADGPTGQAEITINATPAQVWERVSDPTLPPRHSDELYRAEWEPPATGPEVGARIHGWNQRGDVAWDTVSVVTRCVPEQVFEWSVESVVPGQPLATWAFAIDALDEHTTRVVQSVRLGPGPSGLTDAIDGRPQHEEAIIERRLAQQTTAMEANLVAIKSELEA